MRPSLRNLTPRNSHMRQCRGGLRELKLGENSNSTCRIKFKVLHMRNQPVHGGLCTELVTWVNSVNR